MSEKQIRVGENLFLGRLNEQQQFREILRTVALTRADSNNSPFIFLIYGEGGMGKTQLIRRMFDIVTNEAPFERDFNALRLDWQIIRYNTIALQVPRDHIQPETIFDVLHQAVLEKGWGAKFKTYQDTLIKQREVEKQVAQALDQEKDNNQYTTIRDLGASGLAKLVRQFVPLIGQTGENFSQVVLSATVQAGAESLANLREQATQFLNFRAKLKPEQYQMYLNPREQLAQALGSGFKNISHQHPLALFLDTYEIVATADAWLRRVIKASGPRVLWVIAGRDNLAVNRTGDQYFVGYSGEFVRNVFPMDLQVLAVEHLCEYFADRAPHRPLSIEEANTIYRATHGVPLAIHQSADLWMRDVALSEITGQTADYTSRDEIVREMHRRILLHVETNTTGDDDRRALYLLAMQPRPDVFVQQQVLQPPEGKLDLSRRLAELARYYSTVKLEGGARLHEAMHAFINEYLMTSEMRHDETVIQIATQVVTTLQIRRETLIEEGSSLEERLESEDWQQVTLDLVHWLFWKNERDAWHELIPHFIEGLGYELDFAQSLLAIANAFKPTLGRDGRRRLKRLNLDTSDHSIMLTELEQIARQGHWLEDSDPDITSERYSILLIWRGDWQVEKDQYQEALQTYLACEKLLPNEAETLRKRLGRAFGRLSNKFIRSVNKDGFIPSEAGLQAAQRAVVLDKENDSAWHELAHAYQSLGRNEESVAAFLRATELDPEDGFNWKCLGDLYEKLGRFEDTMNAYQLAVKLAPDFASGHNNLGNAYKEIDQYQEALIHHKRAVELEPNRAGYHSNLGNTYVKTGQYQEALIRHKRAVELEPNEASYHNNLGVAYRETDQYQEALIHHKRAVELEPNEALYHDNLGNAYARIGQYQEALIHHKRAVELEPNEASYHNNLGVVYGEIGQYQEALIHHKRAVELEPNNVLFLKNLSQDYRNLNKIEEANAIIQKAIELDPEFISAWHELGHVYEAKGQAKEAIEAFETAIDLDPKDVTHRACLISLYYKLGSFEKVFLLYEEVIQEGLSDDTLHNNMGNVYASIGENENAIAAYKLAVEFDPDNEIAFSNLGNLYHRVSSYEDAITAYQKAVELDPNFAYPYISLTMIFQDLGREQDAKKHLTYARELMMRGQERYNSYNQACLEAVQGNLDAALENLENALLEEPAMRGWAKHDPNLISLRGDSRFERLTQMN